MIRRPVFHVVISVKMNVPTMSGNQPPCTHLQQVGAEEGEVDRQEDRGDGRGGPRGHFQRSVATTCSSMRRDDHRHRDGDAVGGGQRARRFEADDDQDGADRQRRS